MAEKSRRRSIVTGGCGFIGSHVVDMLIERGDTVIVIDNLSSTVHDFFNFNEKAVYVHKSICDVEGTEYFYEDIDEVYHLAAQARIMTSIENPLGAVNTNVMGTATVLELSKKHKVKKVIYSSTSSAYGLANPVPAKETMPEDCLNPYSVSKVAGEKLCSMYSSLFGLPTAILRYFNVYGEREPIKGPYATVVGLFARQLKAGEPLTIVGDGLQRRDFTYVKDVARANLLAADWCQTPDTHGLFNIGGGYNYSVKEIADMISSNQTYIPPRPGEARETLADITKAKEVLGWIPTGNLREYIKGII